MSGLKAGVLAIVLLGIAACSGSGGDSRAAFFATVVPGAIEDGRIYLQMPLLADQSGTRDQREEARDAFFKKAVPGMERWTKEVPLESRKEGYGGDIIPDPYLDLKFIEASTPYKIGQVLRVRTIEGVVPVRLAKFEIHFHYAGGHFFFYAVAEPTSGAVIRRTSQRVIAAADMPDCGKSCALSRIKAGDDKAQRIRAIAVDKLDVVFPSDVPDEDRTETLVIYEGQFTRTDRKQYVAFFARHHKDAMDAGKWVTYIADSDFSLVSVLGQDDDLQIIPDGTADVNGDGLDEIWSNDPGFEGSAYSLWYLGSATAPVSFGRVQWPYFGL